MGRYVVSESIFLWSLQNSRFLSHHSYCCYHLYEWIYKTYQCEGVCSVLTLVEDKIILQSCSQCDPWGFPPQWGLELRSGSCMFDILSTISKKFKVIFMESSDQDVNRYGLRNNSFWQDYFNCCLVIFIKFWWNYYGAENWSKEVSDTILI